MNIFRRTEYISKSYSIKLRILGYDCLYFITYLSKFQLFLPEAPNIWAGGGVLHNNSFTGSGCHLGIFIFVNFLFFFLMHPGWHAIFIPQGIPQKGSSVNNRQLRVTCQWHERYHTISSLFSPFPFLFICAFCSLSLVQL